MTHRRPIACSLSAAALTDRLAEIAVLGRETARRPQQRDPHAELRFAAGARERVDAIVLAESQCCAFLAMSVTDGRKAVVLTIDAPAGAEPAVAEIVDAFRARPQAV